MIFFKYENWTLFNKTTLLLLLNTLGHMGYWVYNWQFIINYISYIKIKINIYKGIYIMNIVYIIK